MELKQKNNISKKTKLTILKIIFFGFIILLVFLPKFVTLAQIQLYGLVTILGIDECNNKVKCTVEVVLPKEGGGPIGETVVITGEGLSVSTAMENLSIASGRELSFSHCSLLVLGEEKAKTWITDELDYLLSSGKVSPEIAIIVSGNKTANEFVLKMSKFDKKFNVDSLLKHSDFGSQNYAQTLVRFIIDMKSRSETAVIPVFEMGERAENINSGERDFDKGGKDIMALGTCEENDESSSEGSPQGNKSNESGGSEKGGGSQEKPVVIKKSEKVAIFYKGKLAAIWDEKESSGLAWFDEKTKKGIIFIQNIDIDDKKLVNLTCQLTDKDIKYKTEFVNGIPVFTVKMKLKYLLEERYNLYALMGDTTTSYAKKVYPAILSEIMSHISEEILEVLKSSIKSGVDPMRVHDKFYKFRNKEYKQFMASGQNLLEKLSLKLDFHIELN